MRRLASLLFLILGASLDAQTPDPEWPRWRGLNADGRWNPQPLPADFAKREPKQLWRVKIGSGFSGVTVASGRVYVMDYTKSPETESVHCLDATSGTEVWRQSWPVTYGKMDYGTGPRASVVIENGVAYALGATGIATCFDAATGKIIWRRDTQKDFAAQIPTWGFAASPFIRKDTVILHVAAQPGGCIIALDKKNGAEKWRAGDDPAGYCTPELIAHGGHEQLIAWGPEHIQSFDPDTGSANWKHPYKITYGVSIAQPLFADGTLIISGYWHGTKALRPGASPRDISLAWEEEKEICGLMSAPLHKNGLAYILDKHNGLTAFEIATGKVRWTDGNTLTPKDRNPQMSIVWLDEKNDLIAALNASGELVYARLKSDGVEELARHQIIGKTWAHPAFTKDKIFARSDTEIVAWQLW